MQWVMNRKQQPGFTLVELLIVLVVISILASIGIPAYQNSTQKARRADAKAALAAAAAAQEKWFFQFNTYTKQIADLGGGDSPEGFYTVSVATEGLGGTCSNSSPYNCYRLTAAPAAGSPQVDDAACTTFVLSHTGRRTATGAESDNCW